MKTLTAKDLVIGGKYVPHSKSAPGYEGLEDSAAWRKAKHRGQHYLIYIGKDKDGHTFWYEMDEDSGDYFLPSDVTPYVEPDTEAKQYKSPATLSEFESDDYSVVDPKEFLPFNLQEALKAPERVVYRNGQKVLEWHYFDNCSSGYPIAAVTPSGGLVAYDIGGSYNISKDDHSLDLMLLPLPKKKYWINVMQEEFSGVLYVTGPWKSEVEAFQQTTFPDECLKIIGFEI